MNVVQCIHKFYWTQQLHKLHHQSSTHGPFMYRQHTSLQLQNLILPCSHLFQTIPLKMIVDSWYTLVKINTVSLLRSTRFLRFWMLYTGMWMLWLSCTKYRDSWSGNDFDPWIYPQRIRPVPKLATSWLAMREQPLQADVARMHYNNWKAINSRLAKEWTLLGWLNNTPKIKRMVEAAGVVEKGQMLPEFESALFDLQCNEVSILSLKLDLDSISYKDYHWKNDAWSYLCWIWDTRRYCLYATDRRYRPKTTC